MDRKKVEQLLFKIEEALGSLGKSVQRQSDSNVASIRNFKQELRKNPIDSAQLVHFLGACEQYSERIILDGSAVVGLSMALQSVLKELVGELEPANPHPEQLTSLEGVQVSIGHKNLLGRIDWRLHGIEEFSTLPIDKRRELLENNLIRFVNRKCEEVSLASCLELLPTLTQ